MQVDGVNYRTIWEKEDSSLVEIIDQTLLPHQFKVIQLRTMQDAAEAISVMRVRGAPLIGATAAYGIALAMVEDTSDTSFFVAHDTLLATRPTAVNLKWALDETRRMILPLARTERLAAAFKLAKKICEDDVETCFSIGRHGAKIIEEIYRAKGESHPVNILTHCNAGWLAAVDWGTALAPVYVAHDAGIPIHVWIDETRPRNQGFSLSAWELCHQNVPHTVIVDNLGGHLMQHGMVDLCITGTDRTAANGDVCNKIGTYLKALAAHDNEVPFYVSLPSSSIDWTIYDGLRDIPIEKRDASEVTEITGQLPNGDIATVKIVAEGSAAINYAFDVTPARLITGFITERGICEASTLGLMGLYPEQHSGSNGESPRK